MRDPSTIQQDIENLKQQLTELEQELHDATIVAYATIIASEQTLIVPISSEISTDCPCGRFTYHDGLQFVFFNEHEMLDANQDLDAARFNIDGESFTWETPYEENGYSFPYKEHCPCTIAVFSSREKAEAWLKSRQNNPE